MLTLTNIFTLNLNNIFQDLYHLYSNHKGKNENLQKIFKS